MSFPNEYRSTSFREIKGTHIRIELKSNKQNETIPDSLIENLLKTYGNELQKAKTLSIDLTDRANPKINITTVKIHQLASQTLPKRERTFKEIFKDLSKARPSHVPAYKMLWNVAILPIAGFNAIFNPGKVPDATSLSLLADPEHRLSLESALEETINLHKQDLGAQKMVHQLEEGLKAAKDFRNPAHDKKEVASYLANQILTEKGAVIPGGYWKDDGMFESTLYAFYRDQEGALHLNALKYGKQVGTDEANLIKFEQDPTPEVLSKMLLDMLKMSDEPEDLRGLKAGEKIALKFAAMTGAPPSSSESSEAVDHPKHLLEGIWRQAGGKLEKEEKSKSKAIQDPAELLFKLQAERFPEAALGDKLMVQMHLVYQRMGQVIEGEKVLTPEQKSYWVNRLEKDYESVLNKMEKNQKNPQVLHMEFHQRIDKLKEMQKEVKLQVEASQQKKLESLNQVKSGKFSISIEPSQLTQAGSAAETSSSKRLSGVRQDLIQLQEAFGSKNLQVLTEKMDGLVASGNYEAAIELYHSVMPCIPTLGHEFWEQLQDPNEVKDISSHLSKLNHYFWESKMKTGNLKMNAEEGIFMMHSEALMHSMIQMRARLISNNPSDEEKRFLAVANNYKLPKFYKDTILSKIKAEAHLRYSENPLLYEKYQKTAQFFEKMKTHDEEQIDLSNPEWRQMLNFNVQMRGFELEDCKKVLEVKGVPADDLEKEAERLWTNYYTSPDIPGAFPDLHRHQFMFASLMYPETSIGINPLGSTAGMGKYIKSKVGSHKDTENIRQALMKDALKKIQTFERLTLSNHFWGPPINRPQYGIIETGKTGAGAVTIAPSGISRIYEENQIEKNENVHAGDLNHPKMADIKYLEPGVVDDFHGAHLYQGDFKIKKVFSQDVFSQATVLNSAYVSKSLNATDNTALFCMHVMDSEGNTTSKTLIEVFDLMLHQESLLERLDTNSEGKIG